MRGPYASVSASVCVRMRLCLRSYAWSVCVVRMRSSASVRMCVCAYVRRASDSFKIVSTSGRPAADRGDCLKCSALCVVRLCVCASGSVCAFVCVRLYVWLSLCVRMRSSASVRPYAFVCVCASVRSYAFVCVCASVRSYAFVCVCAFVCVRMRLCVCAFVCVRLRLCVRMRPYSSAFVCVRQFINSSNS